MSLTTGHEEEDTATVTLHYQQEAIQPILQGCQVLSPESTQQEMPNFLGGAGVVGTACVYTPAHQTHFTRQSESTT